ncbi:MAG: L-lactate permease [Blastocatellia bacterium]
MNWIQVYNPLGSLLLSSLVAALPVVILLGLLAIFHVRAHIAALIGLASAFLVATVVYGMPVKLALAAAANGAAFGLFPIGWIVLTAIFVYDITVETGQFEIVKQTIAGLADDRRIQVLLIAFSFGAFIEGAAGFGTPVAVSAAMLIGLGFRPLQAAGLSLIGNTAPVAFGALGTPIITLAKVTGLPLEQLSAMAGRQLPLFSLIIPFWLIWAMAGLRGMREVWPACLTAGGSFAIAQFLISNYHGPWVVDIAGAIASLLSLVILLKFWRPRDTWRFPSDDQKTVSSDRPAPMVALRAWSPWIILSVLVFIWGVPQTRQFLNGISLPEFAVPWLDKAVFRAPPVVEILKAEEARFTLNWLSATGTALLITGFIAGTILRLSPLRLIGIFGGTLQRARLSLITIAAMMALGFTTRFGGLDSTMGLAFASTGWLFPFFSPLLGWLGVALTGSDTSSNVLFGNLQQVTARQLGISPLLAAAANSSGGVMGKMIDAQSIVVASMATRQNGQEGVILRYVFFHSIALVVLVGLFVMMQAYYFTSSIPAP